MKAIIIYRTHTSWMVDMRMAADAVEVVHLFGSTIFPTAFPPSVAQEAVEKALSKLNPGHAIIRAQDMR